MPDAAECRVRLLTTKGGTISAVLQLQRHSKEKEPLWPPDRPLPELQRECVLPAPPRQNVQLVSFRFGPYQMHPGDVTRTFCINSAGLQVQFLPHALHPIVPMSSLQPREPATESDGRHMVYPPIRPRSARAAEISRSHLRRSGGSNAKARQMTTSACESCRKSKIKVRRAAPYSPGVVITSRSSFVHTLAQLAIGC